MDTEMVLDTCSALLPTVIASKSECDGDPAGSGISLVSLHPSLTACSSRNLWLAPGQGRAVSGPQKDQGQGLSDENKAMKLKRI